MVASTVSRNKNIEAIYPLTPLQEGMLFHTLLAAETGVYVEQLSCVLRGELDAAALERAWHRVVERHSVLRTAFVWEGPKKPLQVVGRKVTLPLEQHDWRELAPAAQAERLDAFLAEDRRAGFKLSKSPLMRLNLIRTGADVHQFVFTFHHLLFDGWSVAILLKEVFSFYEAFRRGQDLPLKQPRHYRDYIHWLEQQDRSQAEGFWRETLKGFMSPTPLGEKQIPANLTSETEAYSDEATHLSTALTASLQVLARRHRLTLSTLVQGTWALLLSRYSGQRDVVFGATTSGRPAELAGGDAMVGLFINTLPMRVEIDPEKTVVAWLKELQNNLVEMRQHEHSALVEIHQWSDVARGVPLFESILVFENYPVGEALGTQSGSLAIENVRSFEQTNYPLTLAVAPGAQMSLQLAYDCRRFDAATIRRMLGHFRTLLEGIVANPQQTLARLPLLTTEEQEQLARWNRTENDYRQDQSLHELFEAQVRLTPDAAAVSFEDQELTYLELDRRANQLANHLRKLGVGADTLVGICVERSLELMVGLLGIFKAGGAYVPLDPAYPKDRLSFLLEDSRVPILLTQQALLEVLPEHAAQIVCLDTDWQRIALESEEKPSGGAAPDNLVYVIYTSGSTGKPKGVMVTHRSLANFARGMAELVELAPGGRFMQFASLNFDASAVQLFPPLISGATVVLHRAPTELSNVELLRFCEEQRITVLDLPAAFLHQWIDDLAAQGTVIKSPLSVFMTGGESPSIERLRALEVMAESFKQFLSSYGPTETTVSTAILQIKGTMQDALDESRLPIGGLMPNTNVHLLDPQRQPVPSWIAGELYIGGAGVARGYLNRPDLTAERFVPDEFGKVPGARLYKTGDLASRRADGNIDFLGRADYQVKIRGFRIELQEIEEVLTQHAAVREAAVLAREDQPGDRRLVAYFIPEPEAAFTLGELRSHLRERLPEYMIPSAFVQMEAFPLTPNKKMDRQALPAPEQTRSGLEETFVAPRTPVEELLANIWLMVLGVERVGIHDNFFELGGHSLLATQVASRIRETFKVELPLRALFETPTVAAVAAAIETTIRAGQDDSISLLQAAEHHGEAPLSYAQQRLWFIDQLDPGNPVYNLFDAIHISGQLDVPALEQTLNEIVRRHQVLRTVFSTIDGRPVQTISPSQSLTLPVVDLSNWPDAQGEVHALIRLESQRPFNLSQAPLLRICLVRLAPDRHVVMLTTHHIISDGWSMGVLIQEISSLYTAFSQGTPSPLADLPVQYADYAQWQRQHLSGETLNEHLAYWREQLRGAQALELPTDRPRPAVQTHHGATLNHVLSPQLAEQLQQLSRREGATLFMTLLAAWQVLLMRYSGQTDITVGTPVAGRTRAEVEPLIGFFVNTLVLRTQMNVGESFRETLARVREVCLGGYAHQEVPFEMLVEQLQPERSLSHSPLFQVMFALQNTPAQSLSLPGVALERVEVESRTAIFDLTLAVAEVADGLLASMEYNTDLFDEATIGRLLGHYETLLESIIADPQQRLSDIQLLDTDEQRQLLVEWNDTTQEVAPLSVHQLFEQQVSRTPDALALSFEDQHLSYTELNARANQLAHYLQGRGIGPESLVGVMTERSAEMVVALLAILKAGGAYLPLDPSYPQERLSYMLEHSQARLLLTQSSLTAQLPASTAEVILLDTDWPVIGQESSENPHASVSLDNLAYVIYTSGSTGQPKGVMVAHAALSNFLHSMQQRPGLVASETLLAVTSLSFDIAALELYLPLVTGAHLVVVSQETAMDAGLLATALAESGARVMQATPATWRMLVESGWEARRGMRVLCGGEALPRKLAGELVSGGGEVWNLYGPTETTIWSAVERVDKADSVDGVDSVNGAAGESSSGAAGESSSGAVTLGRGIANTQLYVLDAGLAVAPVGVAGELYIGGAGLARGYKARAEQTAERFVPHPFAKVGGERLYRTGDVVRWRAEGKLEYLGRADYQVKVRGYRIELEEIEAALSSHESVREAVVVAREEEAGGGKRLVGYVVADESVSGSQLQGHVRERLPEYMVPSVIVVLEEMPLTPNGKVNRKALPVPEAGSGAREHVYVAARTPVEELLASMWREVLRVEQVGVRDNFFSLGGHSLLAAQLIARVRDAFSVEVLLRGFFERPTVEALAEYVEAATLAGQGLTARRLEAVPRRGELPLSFAQERMWFLDQMEPGHPSYNVPGALRLTGKLNLRALVQSVNGLLKRHETLRTRFLTREGRPAQEIADVARIGVQVVDLTALGAAEREQSVRRLATEAARLSFDLSESPLLRVLLFRLGEEDHLGLLTMHHIVSDAWSMGVLIEEMAALYEAFVEGTTAQLPELPIQYADYASWQRSNLKGATLEAHLSYWKKQLGGRLPVMELPTDRPRPEVMSHRGKSSSYAVSPALSEEVKALSRREDATLFMTLLAAFQILLSRYTEREDVIVGSAVANRSHLETERLIGFFINTLVLRTDTSGDPTFRELLARVRETTLGAYAHQDLPFEKLVEELRPERGLNQTPLFQIAFGLQNAPLPSIQLRDLKLDTVEFDLGAVKFDLTVWLAEQPDGLWATWSYRTDLFDEATIEKMNRRFVTLLQSIVAQPENRLSALEMLSEEEKTEQTQRKRERKETNFKKFLSIKPKAVAAAAPHTLVKTSYLSAGETLPLVVQPGSPDVDLNGWAGANAKFIETELAKHGALLFRNFNIAELDDFKRFTRAVADELLDYREPSSPRSNVGDKVYTSTEYPATQWIQLHNEMSYSHRWPLRLFFYCLTPAAEGGATPIAHSGKVFQRLDPKLRARFMEKKVMYVRNFGDGLDLTWQHVFGTTDRSEVERYCRAAGIEFEWKSGDRLRTRQVRQAVLAHPSNGELLWFNQAHAFHVSTLEPAVREALLSQMGAEEIPRNAFYGDGSAIEASVIEEIREAYRETSVSFPWQKGDILMIDNLLVAHGRQPYSGKRQIMVAMSGLTSDAALQNGGDETAAASSSDTLTEEERYAVEVK